MASEESTRSIQYLTFTLGEEDYAIDIIQVREVLSYTAITLVPRMPKFLRGVINLRGNVVPVVDLRLKLGLRASQETEDTCIVIVEIQMDGEITLIGALADSVKEVIDLDSSRIEPPPRLGSSLKTEFIRGIGKRDDKFIIILNIDRVFSEEEMSDLGSIGGTIAENDTGAPDAFTAPMNPCADETSANDMEINLA